MPRRQAPDLKLVADVAGTEHARRESDEGVEDDEHNVDVIDDQEKPRHGTRENKTEGSRQRQKGRNDVDAGGGPVLRKEGERKSARRRDRENGADKKSP